MMRTSTAVSVALGQSLEIMEVNLERPTAGEVLFEIKAISQCHTNEFMRSCDDPEGIFPVSNPLSMALFRIVVLGTGGPIANPR